MYDQEIQASQVKADRFPFPSEGEVTFAGRNTNYAFGPVMLQLFMKPGSIIPAHTHRGMAEALYVDRRRFHQRGKTILGPRAAAGSH